MGELTPPREIKSGKGDGLAFKIVIAILVIIVGLVAYGHHVSEFPKVGDKWTGGQVVTVSMPLTGYVEMRGPGGQLAANTIKRRLEAEARQEADWYGMIVGVDVSVFEDSQPGR